MASALSTFTDFVNVTGPSQLTFEDKVVNEAQKQNYILRKFLRGRAMEDILQGGKKIQDSIMFDEDSTFQFYQPNETFTWENPQVIDNWEIDWRFAIDHWTATDQEIELNAGPSLSKSARHHQYKRLKRIKQQRVWTSILNGIENQLFAVPEAANMEAAGGKQPYSIPAHLNEDTNGLFYSGNTPTGKTAWTTKQSLNPTTYPKWVPQQKSYSSSSQKDPNNIVSKFDELFLDVQFVPPPTMAEYFEDPHLSAQFIACSKRGISTYRQLMRGDQDLYVTTSRQDPAYARPMYSGVALEYVPNLDSEKLYHDGQSASGIAYDDEVPTNVASDVQDSGPRYYWINANYMHPVFHTSRYMYQHPVQVHPNQPTTRIVPIECWYNLVCRSVQRQGILSPSGAVYT